MSLPGSKSTYTRVRKTGATSQHSDDTANRMPDDIDGTSWECGVHAGANMLDLLCDR
jgi:hypothetical protein